VSIISSTYQANNTRRAEFQVTLGAPDTKAGQRCAPTSGILLTQMMKPNLWGIKSFSCNDVKSEPKTIDKGFHRWYDEFRLRGGCIFRRIGVLRKR